MLSKANRLSRGAVEEIVKKGRVIHTPLFSLRFISSDTPSFTTVISKKALKLATSRNKAKRRMREAIRKSTPFPAVSGVFFLKKEAMSAPFSDLSALVRKTLENL